MNKDQEIRHGRHCIFALHVHLVFVTKYRRGVFKAEHMAAMQGIMASICKDFEAQLLEFNGEADHVHLLALRPRHECRGLPLREGQTLIGGVAQEALMSAYASLS